MFISQDTKEVVKYLQDFTKNNLRKPNDLEIFLELGAANELSDLTNEFIFTGSAVWNLYRVINNQNHNKEENKNSETELNENLKKIIFHINSFLKFADKDTVSRFNRIYLVESSGAFLNIIDLAHDLSELKLLQNSLKIKK
ncbi:MAG: hypothetical protein HZB41_04270 [Ignavibacteriae bacterium]|nr:hypothetical protein [Ignavibacteriota bacterium]